MIRERISTAWKVCSCCGNRKPANAGHFYTDPYQPGKFLAKCKRCRSLQEKAQRQERHDRRRQIGAHLQDAADAALISKLLSNEMERSLSLIGHWTYSA